MTSTSILGTAALVGATLSTAMVAGLLFCFAHCVMPGLATLDARDHLTAFQRIDAAIANPWMGATYLGSPALTLAALLLHLTSRGPAVPWLVVALVLILTTIAITAVAHLPINADVQSAAPVFEMAGDLRSRFDERWMPWNVVRTVTSTGALAALTWALFTSGRAAG